MRPEMLANSDAVWISMEEPTNLMIVSGLLLFDEVVDHVRLKQVIHNRLLSFKRFRQRVMQPPVPLSPLFWEDDPHFNIDTHITRMALPSPGDEGELEQMISRLISTPLDQTKPLWQVNIIENYGEGSALLVKMHHALADGLALVMILLSLADFAPDAPPRPPKPDGEKKNNGGGVLSSLIKQASSTVTAVSKMTSNLMSEGMETVKNPSRAIDLAQKGTESARLASQLLRQPADPKTSFKGKLGVRKKVAWSNAIPLNDVKAIKNGLNSGVNEVIIAAVAGALRTYHFNHGQPVQNIPIRAAMPVNLRSSDEMGKLGNKYGVLFVPLPIQLDTAVARLAEVTSSMAQMKEADETVITFGLQKGMEYTHHDLQSELMKLFGARATAVFSNIPGPPMPLYIAGSKIKQLIFWMPQTGKTGLGISVVTYAGQLFLGVATDEGLVPFPDEIVTAFVEEIDSLKSIVEEQ